MAAPGTALLEGDITTATDGEGEKADETEGEVHHLASMSGHYQDKSESLPQQDSEDRKKQHKRKYVLSGGASALAVQLFGIAEAFEMRLVRVHSQWS